MSPVVERRRRELERLAGERWELLVVGGGIVGAGVALDAALRGVKVALVERDDIASGTSSRSSKLIHGGLRYLEHLHFGLVREALRERALLLRLAPHIVSLQSFLVPVYGNPLQVPYLAAGMLLYGGLGAARDGGWPRYLGPRGALQQTPALRSQGLRGAFVYTDGVEDDARLALAVARSASRAGALVLTRVSAARFDDAEGPVEARDLASGEGFGISADTIVDATGASQSGSDVVPSRGSHIVVPRDRIPSAMGMTLRVDGRVVFVIPWKRFWIVGTTDVPHVGDTNRPAPTSEEVDYLLESSNASLGTDLGRGDVVACFAGIRPLAALGGGRRPTDTAHASREHRVRREGRVVSVRGGKYTTYRVMARDTVDAAMGAGMRPGVDVTRDHRLVGAADARELGQAADDIRKRHGLPDELADALVARHGNEALALVARAAERGELDPLDDEGGYLEGEVSWAAEHEWAMSIDDVLARRTRLAIEARDHGASVAQRVSALLGELLEWDAEARSAAVADYAASAEREYDVPNAGHLAEVNGTPVRVEEVPA